MIVESLVRRRGSPTPSCAQVENLRYARGKSVKQTAEERDC